MISKDFFTDRPHFGPTVVAATMLFVALGELPYGYYWALRWVVCLTCLFVGYLAWSWKDELVELLLLPVVLLFNPVIPLHKSWVQWPIIDVAAAILFLVLAVAMLRPVQEGDTLWRRLRFISSGVDPFYWEMKREQIALYQHCFRQMLDAVDVNNLTEQSNGKDYSPEVSARDYAELDKIVREAKADHLVPKYLQVLFEQFLREDTIEREKHRGTWITAATNRARHGLIYDPADIVMLTSSMSNWAEL